MMTAIILTGDLCVFVGGAIVGLLVANWRTK